MSKKLDISSRLNFAPVDLTAPDKVIKNLCDQLSEETNGYIIGAVEQYDGKIESYTQKSSMATVAAMLGESEKKVCIQKSLGKIGNEIKRFEFYLKTPAYEDYKYRILFIEYGTGNYPVKVVLELGVANEVLDSHGGYKITCKNPDELEDLIFRVLSSEHIIHVMQELLNIKQIKDAEEKSEGE